LVIIKTFSIKYSIKPQNSLIEIKAKAPIPNLLIKSVCFLFNLSSV